MSNSYILLKISKVKISRLLPLIYEIFLQIKILTRLV